MGWLVGGVWIGVGVFAVLVIAFCLYEISWKARRMTTDLQRLTGLSEQLSALRAHVESARQRLSEARASGETEQ